MKVTLNGLELARQAPGDQTISEVVRQLAAEINQGGKIIVGIRMDGQWIPRGETSPALAKPVKAVQHLDLTIAELGEAQARALDDAETVVDALKAKSRPTARKFRIGDEVAANNELAALFQDLQLVAASLDHCTRTLKQAPGEIALRRRLDDTAGALVPTLDRIYKAQAAEDYVTVADELEYVLPDHLEQWQVLIRDVRQSAQAVA